MEILCHLKWLAFVRPATVAVIVVASLWLQANNVSHISTQLLYLHSYYEMQTDVCFRFLLSLSCGFGAMRANTQRSGYSSFVCVCVFCVQSCKMIIIIGYISLFDQSIVHWAQSIENGFSLPAAILILYSMINYFMEYLQTAPHAAIHADTVSAESKAVAMNEERVKRRERNDWSCHQSVVALHPGTGARETGHRKLIFMTINYTNMSINCNK